MAGDDLSGGRDEHGRRKTADPVRRGHVAMGIQADRVGKTVTVDEGVGGGPGVVDVDSDEADRAWQAMGRRGEAASLGLAR